MSEIIDGLSLSVKDKLKQYYFGLFRKEGACGNKKNGEKESFTSASDATLSAISSQNAKMDAKSDELYINTTTAESEYKHQYKTYLALEAVNIYLLIFYTLIYIFILLVILRKYYKAEPRDPRFDAAILLAFLAYPFTIYTVEMYLFKLLQYIYRLSVAFFYFILRFFQGNE